MSKEKSYSRLHKVFSLMDLLDPSSTHILSDISFKDYAKSKLKKNKDETSRKIKSEISTRVRSIDRSLSHVFFHNASLLQKFFYPFTLINLFLIGLIMGQFPFYFHIYYTLLLFVLMPIRFYTYFKKNNQYFLADLCYFVNLLCLIFIWIFPDSESLYHSCFAFSFGSLAFAVIMWRNSLVMHSIDKITSCFIHIMPPCTMYVIQHSISSDFKRGRFPAALPNVSYNMKINIYWTSIYYLIWQSLYHYFITVRKSAKIESGQRTTSFTYLTTHNFKDLWVVKLPAPLPMICYIICQYCYQLVTMLLCNIWFNYKKMAATFLFAIFYCAARNGAIYYVDHYGKKFEKELISLRSEIEQLQQDKKLLMNNQNHNSKE